MAPETTAETTDAASVTEAKRVEAERRLETAQMFAERRAALADAEISRTMETIASQLRSELQEEDRGWKRIDQLSVGHDLGGTDRAEIREKCAKLWQIDGIAGQIVSLTGSGTFGTGVSVPRVVVDEDEAGFAEAAQAVLGAFWEDADNSAAFCSWAAQIVTNVLMFIDGERFFTLHSAANDWRIKLADIPCGEISEVVTAPGNRLRPVLYKREWVPAKYDFDRGAYDNTGSTKATAYYLDASFADWMKDEEQTIAKDVRALIDGARARLVPDVHIAHLKVNTVGKRGIPHLYRAYDWVRAHSRSVSDLTTLAKSLAMFAWLRTVKTQSAATLQKFAENDRRPTPGPGAIHTSNDKVDMDPVNVSSGGVGNLEAAARQTKLQAIASFGMGEHWYGDASTGNLATATAMELPAIQRLEGNQTLFGDLIEFVCDFQIRRAQAYGRAITIRGERHVLGDDTPYALDVNFPPAQPRTPQGAAVLLPALVQATQAGLLEPREASYQAYEAIGANNIAELLEQQYGDGEAEEPQEPEAPDASAAPEEGVPSAEDDQTDTAEEGRAAEAVRGPFGLTPEAAKIEKVFAAALDSRIIVPWLGRVKSWLREQGETPPASPQKMEAEIRARLRPDAVKLAQVLGEYHLRAANAAGQHALDQIALAIRGMGRQAEAHAREAQVDEDLLLSEKLRAGKLWNEQVGGLTFFLRDPRLLRVLRQQGEKITGEITSTMLEDLRRVLDEQIFREGQSPMKIARELDSIFPATYRNRGENIARTEVVMAQGVVTQATYEENGVDGRQWFALLDAATRPEHAEAHGQVRSMGQPFDIGGEAMMHPGDPSASIENIARCRCDMLPVIGEATALPAQPWVGGYQPNTAAARMSAAPVTQ